MVDDNLLRSLVWTADGGLRLHLGGEICEVNNPGEGFQSIAELLKQPGVSMSAQHLAHMGIGGPATSHGWDRRRNGMAEAYAAHVGEFTNFEDGRPCYDGIGADGAATKLIKQIGQQIRRALRQLKNAAIANELRASILETDQGWEYRGEAWNETVIGTASGSTPRPKMRRQEDGSWLIEWQGESHILANSMGMHYISILLSRPAVQLPASELRKVAGGTPVLTEDAALLESFRSKDAALLEEAKGLLARDADDEDGQDLSAVTIDGAILELQGLGDFYKSEFVRAHRDKLPEKQKVVGAKVLAIERIIRGLQSAKREQQQLHASSAQASESVGKAIQRAIATIRESENGRALASYLEENIHSRSGNFRFSDVDIVYIG